jgi:hypothetical protein
VSEQSRGERRLELLPFARNLLIITHPVVSHHRESIGHANLNDTSRQATDLDTEHRRVSWIPTVESLAVRTRLPAESVIADGSSHVVQETDIQDAIVDLTKEVRRTMITSEETHSIGNSNRNDIQVKGKGVALVEGNVSEVEGIHRCKTL